MGELNTLTGLFRSRRRALPVLLAVLSVLPTLSYASGYIYRYLDDNGNVVVGHSIPAEYVDNGYEMLNSDYSVYKEFAPAPTAEEIASRTEAQKARIVAEREAERLQQWDESLLLRYSSIEDIEAARERALSELQIRISILKGNVRSLKAQVENNQTRAADVERRGGEVPEEILSAIDALRYEIDEAEKNIIERSREKEEVYAGFERDIGRFEQLLEKVEIRRRYSRSALE
ncbi:hypothetical protein EYC98_03970 [Halieaceae bacterium IMCC14734]|uniref:DUF4124 domain-containing protein n=1 Tax=Candidatus Litorirhabdus singularis TaxID=2518993 RepID=A0ABT3TCL2_9GAMM|nr:hypothetical protein [Candidatus Litorirhabdus singularis]MCX2980019.1 hypothetical protein [Candidatus Litorirhabdus singularis]